METTTLEYGDDQTDHFETSHIALDVIVPFSQVGEAFASCKKYLLATLGVQNKVGCFKLCILSNPIWHL